MRPVISLRIPGVDYPAAESVLGVRTTEPVDDLMTRGQFWRWRAGPPRDCTVEAYLWGSDSTPTSRALTMLLLPFTLMNVAYWARPPRRHGVVNWAADASVGILCRLIGLTLTVTLVLAAAGSTMDLLAWQCLGSTGCTGSWPQPFDLIGEVPLAAGPRLAAGAVLPLLVLAGLWSYSLRTWRRHERRVSIPLRPDQLTQARFWRGKDWVERVRASHVIVGMAVVDGLLAYPMARGDTAQGSRLAWVGYGLLLLVLVAVGFAVMGALVSLPAPSQPVKDPLPPLPSQAEWRWVRAASATYLRAVGRAEDLVDAFRARAHSAASPVTETVRRAAWATVLITAGTLAYAVWPRPVPVLATGPVPGYAGFVVILSALQIALLLGLGAAMIPLCRAGRRSGQRMALSGFVAPIIAATAVMLAVAEAAGTLYFTALSIGQLKPSGTGRAWEPAPPYPYEWAGLVFALALGCAAVAGLVLLRVWRRLVRSGARLTDRRDPDLRTADPDAAAVLDHAHARGRILDYVPALYLIMFVPAAVLSSFGLACSALGRAPSVLISSPALANLGTWSIGLLAVVVVYLVARTGTMTPVRRTISTIWALATFWPRAAHPFAAPAHGPRAVADLVSRISRLTAQGFAVLVAGHSHGALLGTVAVTYLPPEVATRTALLTSASTANRLIEPFFGAFLNRTVCDDVATALAGPDGCRWRNLYRLTDPIGGPIFVEDRVTGGSIDRLSPDPPATAPTVGVDPQPRGHDQYLHDPVFIEQHAHLVARLADEP